MSSSSFLYVGGDVSKGYADFIILDARREVIESNFRLDDTASGHAALKKLFASYYTANPGVVICVGVESTGGLENNWLAALQSMSSALPVKCARINPCPIKKYLDAELKRTRTDEVSAWGIASFMITHPDKVLFDQDDPFYSSRRQWNTMALLKKQVKQLLNQFQSYLYSANPGVLIHCRNGMPSWMLSVLHRWPTAKLLAKASVADVASIEYVKASKAQTLIANAKDSVASQTDETTEFVIRQLIDHIHTLRKSISTMEDAFSKQWGNHPQVQLLTSFKGIGVLSAMGLLINIRDHKLFSDAAHLASYFGIHPVYRKSGDGVWGFHMSKQGRAEPRAILYMVTLSAVLHNPLIRDLYARFMKQGRKPMAVVGICMHKILRIVYGMLKNNTPFDPQIDIRNRSRRTDAHQEKQVQAATEKKHRRFQPVDQDAPISYRQAKKRKENGSQVASLHCAGSPSSFPCNKNKLLTIGKETSNRECQRA
jgi:transposase